MSQNRPIDTWNWFTNSWDDGAHFAISRQIAYQQRHHIAAVVTHDEGVHNSTVITLTNGETLTIVEDKIIVTDDPFFSHDEANNPVEPPPLAEMLLTFFARTKSQQAAIGDLSEKFERNCAALGVRRARRIYRAEAWRSMMPFLLASARKLLRWTVLAELIRAKLGF